MSLGTTTYENNKNEVYTPQVFSAYAMSNTTSKIDPTNFSFTFWNKMLKLSIAPMIVSDDPSVIRFDHKASVSIFLNHTKARILEMILLGFLKDPKAYDGSSVPSGKGLVTISSGKEFESKFPCLIIRTITPEGTVSSSYAYQFKNDYHYSIKNYKADSGEFEKDFAPYANLEIEQLITLLHKYYEEMTGATAAVIMDTAKYETARANTRIDKIAEKLGVSFDTKAKVASTSYFNNPKAGGDGKGYSQSSIDEIMG